MNTHEPALWTWPTCRRSYANRNQWHSCVTLTEAERLACETPHARELYDALKEVVGEVGPFRVHAQKTRIAFITRMSFVNITFRSRWLNVGIILNRALDSERFSRVERYGPGSVGHYLRLSSVTELDDELRAWLEEAYGTGTGPRTSPSSG